MSPDYTDHNAEHLASLVDEQVRGLTAMQGQLSALTAKASAADGTVEVTVDGRGMLINTVVDESYLEDFEMADLGAHVTNAAQAAVRDLQAQAGRVRAPMAERRQSILALSEDVVDDREFKKFISMIGRAMPQNVSNAPAITSYGDDNDPQHPVVRARE